VSPVPPLSAVLRRRYDFPSRIHGRLLVRFHCPRVTSAFVLAAALPQDRRVSSGPGRLLVRPPQLPASSYVDANGISQVSRRSVPCLCSVPRPRSNQCTLAISVTSMLPPLPIQRRLRQLAISGLTHAASAPADLRFAFRVATHAQGSLPAGWLAFAGRASNPLDRYERFQLVLTIIPLSCSPDANGLSLRETHHFTTGD